MQFVWAGLNSKILSVTVNILKPTMMNVTARARVFCLLLAIRLMTTPSRSEKIKKTCIRYILSNQYTIVHSNYLFHYSVRRNIDGFSS